MILNRRYHFVDAAASFFTDTHSPHHRGQGLISRSRAPRDETIRFDKCSAWVRDFNAVVKYLDKQMRFDPDIWIVEIEDRDGRAFVDEPIV